MSFFTTIFLLFLGIRGTDFQINGFVSIASLLLLIYFLFQFTYLHNKQKFTYPAICFKHYAGFSYLMIY